MNLLKKPVFENGDINWIDVLLTKTKQYNNRRNLSSKLTPIQGSLRKNERFAYQILVGERKKNKLKYEIGELVRTADLKKTF